MNETTLIASVVILAIIVFIFCWTVHIDEQDRRYNNMGNQHQEKDRKGDKKDG